MALLVKLENNYWIRTGFYSLQVSVLDNAWPEFVDYNRQQDDKFWEMAPGADMNGSQEQFLRSLQTPQLFCFSYKPIISAPSTTTTINTEISVSGLLYVSNKPRVLCIYYSGVWRSVFNVEVKTKDNPISEIFRCLFVPFVLELSKYITFFIGIKVYIFPSIRKIVRIGCKMNMSVWALGSSS